jgi:glycosyltransferase involved in cell wall biosynthesis
LYTSRFAYGSVPVPRGYVRRELFYRRAHVRSSDGRRSRLSLALKLAEHVPDMLRYRRAARAADIVHFQWLTVQPLDLHLLPPRRVGTRPHPNTSARPKLVLTAHDVLPREPRPGQLSAQRRLYERMDAVVVHSEDGRRRLTDELGIDPERVHVIPHGVLRPWEQTPGWREAGPAPQSPFAFDQALPRELRGVQGPVVLFFGLLRPYKGLDVLLEAWRGVEGDAELWIVGMPRMDIAALRAAAATDGHGGGTPVVRIVPRFVTEGETLALMQRASLVVLPYREIDQSGVVFTALGAGAPLLLSDVGGFPDIARTGAARLVASGDPSALRGALSELLGDPEAIASMATRARVAGATEYAWPGLARRTLDLYQRLLEQ